MHCGALVEPEQWFGKDRLNSSQTWYRMHRFVQALETPYAVVLLDEINRPHPEVLHALFGLLDWRRSMWVDDLGRDVSVAAGVVLFATINEGEDYTVNPLDGALRERFGRALEMKYPPKRETAEILWRRTGCPKDTAEKLAELREAIHRNPHLQLHLSVRQLLIAAEEFVDCGDIREAILTSVINHMPEMQQKKAVLEVLQHLGSDVSDVMTEIEEA